jgi:mannose-1-phosphate guanylyltransferase/mannose-6-phosphate isomerase
MKNAFVCVMLCLSGIVHLDAQNNYVVILAGGKGERLWPLSRQLRPKQLLSFQDGKSLLEHTIDRVADVVDTSRIWVVTNADQRQSIEDLIGHDVGHIIAEPTGRNTGPAILYSCLSIIQEDPDACIAFLPADHAIEPKEDFKYELQRMFEHTSNCDDIALMGLHPTYPATGYGYIEYAGNRSDSDAPHRIVKFHEKPSKDVALFYCTSRHMLWNLGIFCARAQVFIDEFAVRAPDMYEIVCRAADDVSLYENVPSVSVDYAIMEKSDRTVVFPVQFAWSDVGNLDIFLSLKGNDDGASHIVSVDSKDNLIEVSDRLVALVGVDDLCVVQTEDVLLIAKRSEVEKVKHIVQKLQHKDQMQYV